MTIKFTTSPVPCLGYLHNLLFTKNKHESGNKFLISEKKEDNPHISINYTRKSNQLKMGNCFGASGGSDDDVDQVRYGLKLKYIYGHFHKAGLMKVVLLII